jgi:methionine sulfoxide reductase heme-binding subunit
MIATSTSTSTHLFWLTSRAAGTTALVLSSLALTMGLAMALGGRRVGLLARSGAAERRSIHEALALATMVAIVVHALSLIGDSYLRPSIIDVTVPFAFSYKTLPTSLGILAGWGLIILGLSYYLRGRIGIRRWRLIHRLTALAWGLGIVHTFTEGSDAGQPWFLALVLLPLVVGAALLGARMLKPLDRPKPAANVRRRVEPSAT